MRVSLVAAACCAAVLLALVIVLGDSERRQAGSNYVPEFTPEAVLRGADERCRADQIVPKDAAGLRLLVDTDGPPVPALAVRVSADGEPVTRGRLPAGRPAGHVVVELDPVRRTTGGATVCVRARAPEGRRTVLHGTLGQVRFEWLREGRESWFELFPTVAHRFSLGKANPFGWWLLPLAAITFLLAAGAALRLIVRELGR